MAPSRLAVSSTWLAGTNRNSGFGSMKQLISHGQAMRSTRARSRVIHFMTSLLSQRNDDEARRGTGRDEHGFGDLEAPRDREGRDAAEQRRGVDDGAPDEHVTA